MLKIITYIGNITFFHYGTLYAFIYLAWTSIIICRSTKLIKLNLTLYINTHLNLPTNVTAGQAGTIVVKQDGTGSRTLSYSSVWDFAGGTAPTLTTTASAVDRIDYVVYSTSRIQAVATLAYS